MLDLVLLLIALIPLVGGPAVACALLARARCARRMTAIVGLLLAVAIGGAQAQLPPASGLVINQTPVQGGSAGQCLFINNQQLSSQACGGAPSGAAGGDLGGTYPNPTVTNLSHVTNASLANSGLATPAPCSAFGTAAGTCAQGGVITAGGPTGSATVVPIITYNAAGQLTTVSSATITPAASSITGAAALTKVDDTNVTLTLGGAPSTALLGATSITAGWTGTLANARLATMATNTVKGNATSGTASPTDLAVGTCSTAASALIWTTNTGFGCNTFSVAATTQPQWHQANATFTTASNSSTSTVYHYRLCGPGGGGGGANGTAAAAGGGSAGSCADGTFTGVAASTAVTITAGTGGAAGSSAGGNGGNGSAATTIAATGITTISCPAGNGGTGSTAAVAGAAAGGTGPAACSGGISIALNIQGGYGMSGTSMTPTAADGLGGNGGVTLFGGGGIGGSAATGAGFAATGCGSGGGGSIFTTAAGTAGANGCAILDWVL